MSGTLRNHNACKSFWSIIPVRSSYLHKFELGSIRDFCDNEHSLWNSLNHGDNLGRFPAFHNDSGRSEQASVAKSRFFHGSTTLFNFLLPTPPTNTTKTLGRTGLRMDNKLQLSRYILQIFDFWPPWEHFLEQTWVDERLINGHYSALVLKSWN